MADNEHVDGGADGQFGTPAEDSRSAGGPGTGGAGYGRSGGGEDSKATPALGNPSSGSADPSVSSTSGLAVFGEGRYRLTHRLGRGGMAEVFAARDVRLGRTVAIKVLRPELAEDSTARIRFTREAHSVASLNHHAVVAVYDTGEEAHGDETVPYIVMELVEGHTVRELLQGDEPPPVDQALIITAGILEALAYSHRHGIVHRDIKPANVIITNSGAVKVMDFGIARALTGVTSTMTQTGMVMGTPQYLSPEQALGKSVDHRSDLYATGCMLYELLTLRPPFMGDTPLSVVYQHVQDMPVPPSQANSRVPASLDALVLRSLAKEPDDRFQGADEFRAHLQQALRTMHQATGPTELLPGGAAAAAAMAPTMINTSVPSMATQAIPMNVGSAGPPHYEDPYDPADDDEDGGGRRTAFAVIAVLVALAAVGVVVALVLQGDSGRTPTTPGPGVSVSTPLVPSTAPATDAPTDPDTSTPTSTPQTQTPTITPTLPVTPSVTPSASATPSTTPSATPSASTPPPPPPSATPTAPASGAANGGGDGGGDGGGGGGGGTDPSGAPSGDPVNAGGLPTLHPSTT